MELIWITFPDGTICDPTVFASFEKDAGRLAKRPIQTLPLVSLCDFREIPIEMEYFPVLVGEDYLLRANAFIKEESTKNILGREIARNLFTSHLMNNQVASFNEMKSFYKHNEPENYNELVAGFKLQMKCYVEEGKIIEKQEDGDTLFSINLANNLS